MLTAAPADLRRRVPPREPRVRVNRELDALFGPIREYVTNVSRSGAFVQSRTPRAVGTRIPFSFSVILDDFETLRGIGEVVRVSDVPRGMALQFVEIDSASRDVLARLLARATERGDARP